MTLSSSDSLESAETLFQKIHRIEIQSARLATNVLAGAYRSAFKGRGIEFSEVREYVPGDDVRTIDWSVTARMDRPFVKSFQEERDLTMFLVVDRSASCNFGSGQSLKSTWIAEIAAVLAFSAIKNHDRVGLIIFSDKVDLYLPPSKGLRHVLRVIRELLVERPYPHDVQASGSALKQALVLLEKTQVHSSICFVLSDFLSDGYQKAMQRTSIKHELINLCIVDPLEKEFPNIGLACVTDLETREQAIIDTTPEALSQFALKAAERLKSQERWMKKMGLGWIELQTNQPYIPLLRQFFKERGLRDNEN